MSTRTKRELESRVTLPIDFYLHFHCGCFLQRTFMSCFQNVTFLSLLYLFVCLDKMRLHSKYRSKRLNNVFQVAHYVSQVKHTAIFIWEIALIAILTSQSQTYLPLRSCVSFSCASVWPKCQGSNTSMIACSRHACSRQLPIYETLP